MANTTIAGPDATLRSQEAKRIESVASTLIVQVEFSNRSHTNDGVRAVLVSIPQAVGTVTLCRARRHTPLARVSIRPWSRSAPRNVF
jgi:hypothetical protein